MPSCSDDGCSIFIVLYILVIFTKELILFYNLLKTPPLFVHFYPTALKGFGVLFSPMASGWAFGHSGGRAAANILSGLDLSNYKGKGVDTWWGHWLGGVGVQRHSLTLI